MTVQPLLMKDRRVPVFNNKPEMRARSSSGAGPKCIYLVLLDLRFRARRRQVGCLGLLDPAGHHVAVRRAWSFNPDLMDPVSLPPGKPNVGDVLRASFREVF
ncbi:MAG: hypothetical protein PVJ64_13940 [Gemmatimonadales bacterium]|jgi:hypothetical protein